MRISDEKVGRNDAEEFAENLKRRAQAAKGLEKDLLTEVPMLYGSADGGIVPMLNTDGRVELLPNGDPGIVLARVHREQMLRRNGYDISKASGTKSDVSLPFERTMKTLLIVYLIFEFARWLSRFL